MSNQTNEAVNPEDLSILAQAEYEHIMDMLTITSGDTLAHYSYLADCLENGQVWPVMSRQGPSVKKPDSQDYERNDGPINKPDSQQEPVSEPDVPAHKIDRWTGKNLGMSEIRERGERYINIRERQESEVNSMLAKIHEKRHIAKQERIIAEVF